MKRPIQDWFKLLPEDIAEKAVFNHEYFPSNKNTHASRMTEAINSFDWSSRHTTGNFKFWAQVSAKYAHLNFDEKITIDGLKRID